MSTEQWKDVVGYEGLYQVSNLGRVKKLAGTKCRADRMRKLVVTPNGRLQIALYKNNIERKFLVHRLVLIAFVGKPKINQITRHLDGNPMNNYLTNLRWGTHVQNQADSVRHGTKINPPKNDNSGTNNGQNKLSEQQVAMIKQLADRGLHTQQQIANMYGITQQTVSDIKRNRSWSHLNE